MNGKYGQKKQFVVGFHAVEEYIKAPPEGAELLLERSRKGARYSSIKKTAEAQGVRIRRVSAKYLDQLVSDTQHKGIVLVMPRGAASSSVSAAASGTAENAAHLGTHGNNNESLSSVHAAESPASLKDFLLSAAEKQKKSTVVLLDEITDPHNLGAVLRSADLFAVDLVVIPSRRSVHLNETVVKVSSGAAKYVPVLTVANLVSAIKELQKADYWVYAADMDGQRLPDISFPEKRAVVMGAEGKGVGRLVKETCDGVVTVPSQGHIDSLNVSVAAGIIFYKLFTE
ncbi:MAG: 23S rRNA (guanosine(2251)-2'-O)-methyltransferase RlmB [Spirochaetales bacterium]|nr:23S rRNA (guanosine(2251)-2'-O)-methyltransferase RlmB [Spirochaetales bacterium]